MATIKLKHINAFRDRHGRRRHYFRRGGGKSTPLPGFPGSAEFMAAYAEALKGSCKPTGVRRTAGTVSAVVLAYLRSAAFHGLADVTKRDRRTALESFAAEHGDKRVATLLRRHVQEMIDANWATPGVARIFLSSLSTLMTFAVETGLREDKCGS